MSSSELPGRPRGRRPARALRSSRVAEGWLPALAMAVLIVTVGCGSGNASESGLPTAEIRLGGERLIVEVAATPESRRQGLMNRERLGEDRGMLFVFPDSDFRSFWMKDTSIPLSLAYLREDGLITGIHELEPFSLESVDSRAPAKYALEVNRGTFERLGVGPGDRILLPPSLPDAAENR